MTKSRRRRQRLPTEPVTLTVERLSHEGRGVVSHEGKVAFVEGALPGETVVAQYTSRRSQFDELRTLEVLKTSPERVEPPCEVAGLCGGCLLQHFALPGQLRHKQQVLWEHLKHAAGITEFERLPVISASALHYRRKARLAVRYVHKRGEVLVGFREKGNTFITDMRSCPVLVEPVAKLIDPLRTLLVSMDGRVDIPQIEVAVGERSTADDSAETLDVVLVLRHLQPLSESDRQRLREFADQHQICWYLQSGGPSTVERFWPGPSESDALQYTVPVPGADPVVIQFLPGDFTQVNGEVNRLMVAQALSLLELNKSDTVLDLFCGLGNFTLPMARLAGEVVGVEGSQEMVERAGANARLNQIENATFHAADLFVSFDAAWASRDYNKLLLDPPRSGAIEIVSRMHELNPQTIVYVSCNPATLGRDAAKLKEQGYRLTHAGIMDMFPHTGHVESMARFIKAKS